MYYTAGLNEVLCSINSICGFSTLKHDLSSSVLRENYHKFLLNKSIFNKTIDWDTIKIMDFEQINAIAPNFYVDNKKFYAINSAKLSDNLQCGFFDVALQQFQKNSNELYGLAQFLIKIIIINQLTSYTNGTTLKTIGLSSMDFKDHFDEHDFIELLVHQLIHIILFIDYFKSHHITLQNMDVMIEVGMPYRLGGTAFPAYLAFHSYIVGVEILAFRNDMGRLMAATNYHGSTARIIRVTTRFQQAVMNHIHLFEPSARSLFEKSCVLLDSLSTNYHLQNNVG
jgi:hypothetical protein